MITREEYLKALDIVEQYHKELNRKTNPKITFSDFRNNYPCSVRLSNIIKSLEDEFDFVNDIEPQRLLKEHGCGMRTYNEFKEIKNDRFSKM